MTRQRLITGRNGAADNAPVVICRLLIEIDELLDVEVGADHVDLALFSDYARADYGVGFEILF